MLPPIMDDDEAEPDDEGTGRALWFEPDGTDDGIDWYHPCELEALGPEYDDEPIPLPPLPADEAPYLNDDDAEAVAIEAEPVEDDEPPIMAPEVGRAAWFAPAEVVGVTIGIIGIDEPPAIFIDDDAEPAPPPIFIDDAPMFMPAAADEARRWRLAAARASCCL